MQQHFLEEAELSFSQSKEKAPTRTVSKHLSLPIFLDPNTTRPALSTISIQCIQCNQSKLPTISTHARKTCLAFLKSADSTSSAEAPLASKGHGVDLCAPAWQWLLRDRVKREATSTRTRCSLICKAWLSHGLTDAIPATGPGFFDGTRWKSSLVRSRAQVQFCIAARLFSLVEIKVGWQLGKRSKWHNLGFPFMNHTRRRATVT